MTSSVLDAVLLVLALTQFNAFLVGAEMAFVSLNPAKIKELADAGDKKDRRMRKLLDDSHSFISIFLIRPPV